MRSARDDAAARRRAACGRHAAPRGFVLVVVVWSLGLITLLGTMAIVGARYRSRDTRDLGAIARAAAAADSAVALGILHTMAARPPLPRVLAFGCTLPDGATVTVMVTREAGKVDLNAAPLPLLTRLFTGLTRDPARGKAVAEAILAYRAKGDHGLEPGLDAAYRADGKPEGPKRAPFLTPLELDQVLGVSPDLLAAALPFVTVVAGRPEPDPAAVTPALQVLLDLRPAETQAAAAVEAPAPAGGAVPAGPVTVRVAVRTPENAWAAREALVAFGGGAMPYRITEWRQGILAPDEDRTLDGSGARPCLR